MADNAIMVRAHSLPVAPRQAPPKPPLPPAASMVFLAPHSRARARISRAGMPVSPSAHWGDFGQPSLTAEHIVLPLVKAKGVGGHVFFVVGPFAQPGMGDGQAKGHIGAEPGGEPFVGEQAGGVVEVRVDEDHLYAQSLEPVAAGRAFEGSVDAAARAFRVGRPEDDHFGILQSVFQQVVLLGDAEAMAEAPHVHAAPVPAFPTVRVVFAIGKTDQVHEAVIGAGAVAQNAP